MTTAATTSLFLEWGSPSRALRGEWFCKPRFPRGFVLQGSQRVTSRILAAF
jgi:hypothetical protein